MTTAELLKQAIKDRGMNAQALADNAGVNPKTIGFILAGSRPRPSTLEAIAKGLGGGLTAEDLMGDEYAEEKVAEPVQKTTETVQKDTESVQKTTEIVHVNTESVQEPTEHKKDWAQFDAIIDAHTVPAPKEPPKAWTRLDTVIQVLEMLDGRTDEERSALLRLLELGNRILG